ncbi:MAG: hypothetical protein HOV81_34535, partial [Kofleriaceae bacterium]|nr:hypothetical protein [Kofleriaceae bacterium]
MSSSDGDDPEKEPDPSSTLAGFPAPTQQQQPRRGLPPPTRSGTTQSPPLRQPAQPFAPHTPPPAHTPPPSAAAPPPAHTPPPGAAVPKQGAGVPRPAAGAPHSGPTGVPQSGPIGGPHSGPAGVPQYASGPATQPQSISGATTQPTFTPPEQSPFAAGQPQPFTPTGHGAAPQGPIGPAQPQAPFAAAQPEPLFTQNRSGGIPEARLLESESSPIEKIAETVGEIPNRFINFLKLSSKRAFRLRIEPTEVLPDEKMLLEQASPPIT